jgi:predicted membrane protein (TIGR00267 family)
MEIVSRRSVLLFRKDREFGPILRRFLVNTLFDSTFMQLGIIMGSVSTANPDLRLVIGTLISSSVALGISTGVSVYESETLERERRVAELEKALFRNLDNTMITENYRTYAAVLSLVNFLTPFACCSIVCVPLILAAVGLLSVSAASWVSGILALGVIFVAGVYLGRRGRQNPLVKGIKMTAFGAVAFAIGFLVQTFI